MMNTYLVIGAFFFEYEGRTIEKVNGVKQIVIDKEQEGFKVVLQDVNTNQLFLLTINNDVEVVNTPNHKYTPYMFYSYALWTLQECNTEILDSIDLVPKSDEDTHIDLSKTQGEQPDIEHSLFQVLLNGVGDTEFSDGEWDVYESKWKSIKKK